MKLAFLLHFYQPPMQDENVLKDVAQHCYIPLIKLIKSKKYLNLTLNIPLSLLELLEKYGYHDLLNDMKELVRSERVELAGSAAYHPLLTRVTEKVVENQIILNEYALGYFFGRRTGFEGEPSIMIKDLNGFFPPELAIDNKVVGILDSLDYRWVMVDEVALPPETDAPRFGIFSLEDRKIKVVVRQRELSNLLAFKRDIDSSDFVGLFLNLGASCAVVLDAETFGVHYKEGVVLLDEIVEELIERNVEFVTTSKYVLSEHPRSIDSIVDSTWGATDEDMKNRNIYPMWDISGNSIQKSLWEIVGKMMKYYNPGIDGFETEGYENIPVWKEDFFSMIKDEKLLNTLKVRLLFNKALNSDQFWWASSKNLMGQMLFDPKTVMGSLAFARQFAELLGNQELNEFVKAKSAEIEEELENMKLHEDS